MSARIAIAFAVLTAIALPRAEAKFEPPKLEGYLVDTTHAVSSTYTVNKRLEDFRKLTGYAIVVFVTGTLDNEPIDDVAYTTFNTWKVGDAGKDNGILLVIAPAEHKIRIETGKGAGGAVTDIQSRQIIEKMAPAMKAGKVDDAIDVACTELQKLVVKDIGADALRDKVKKEAAEAEAKQHRSEMVWMGVLIGFLAVMLLIGILCLVSVTFRTKVWPIIRAIGTALWWIVEIASIFTGRGKGGGGSSSGGGGGSSGGGGARGDY